MFISLTLLGATLTVFFVFAIPLESWRTSKRYKHISWAGNSPHQWWRLNLVRLKNLALIAKHKSLIDEHWAKDKAIFIPSLMGDQLVLPPADLDWMLEQPEVLLNSHAQANKITQAAHTLICQYGLDNPTHITTLSKDMTRRLGDLTEDIIDEVARAVDKYWGVDSNHWQNINPYETLLRIVARTSSRLFVGSPLCEDAALIENAIAMASSVIPLAFLVRMVPQFLQPALVPLITYHNRSYRQKLKDILTPEVQHRLKMADPSNETDLKASATPSAYHNDFLQWTITNALASNNPQEKETNVIVDRIIFVYFGAIHTSTITITNTLFDLISLPSSSQNILSTLRNEVNGVLATDDNTWTKTGLSRMTSIDSALKESGRMGQLSQVGVVRLAGSKSGGLIAPISGTLIPEGTSVGVPIHMIHRNPAVYADPDTYHPFRFVATGASDEMRTAARNDDGKSSSQTHTMDPESAPPPSGKDSQAPPPTPASPSAFPTTSPTYLLFGHGRRACPGRFFAADMLKTILAYILQNYDFEMLDQRPENRWFGWAVVCPMDKMIRIRREKERVGEAEGEGD